MKQFHRLVAVAALPLALAACSQSGGSSREFEPVVPANPKPVAFTSWSDVEGGGRVVASGVATESTFDLKWEGEGPDATMEATMGEAGAIGKGTADFRFRDDRNVESILVNGTSNTRTWTEDGSQEFETPLTHSIKFMGVAGYESSVFVEPVEAEFEYQTFGTWASRTDSPRDAVGHVGGVSVGSQTPGALLPTSGTARFEGYATGSVVLPDASVRHTVADARLDADFAQRSVTLETFDTRTFNVGTGDVDTDIGLNINARMDWKTNNGFVGNAATVNGMSGVAGGYFYGPNAQEIGGTFSLQADGHGLYSGAFGAKR